MADWKQIEKDFETWFAFNGIESEEVVAWFKSRLETEYPPIEKLSEEEKNEFYNISVTEEIKPNYGK